MYYPTLKNIPAVREAVDTFRGLNQGQDTGPGEFSRMENLTADCYPVLATCKQPRRLSSGCQSNVLVKEDICYVVDGELSAGQERYDLGLTPGKKRLVSMGAYILIFPDKVYFNTADPQDYGPIEQVVEEANWELIPCDAQGAGLVCSHVSPTAPEAPTDGQLWFDTSRVRPCFCRYNAASHRWAAVESFVCLALRWDINPKWPYEDYFTDCFSTGDSVSLDILGDELIDLDHGFALEGEAMNQAVYALEGEHTVTVLSGTRLMFPGAIPERICVQNTLRLRAPMPDMDFLFECGNRLWGCRYGLRSGRFVNEIYASRLGDFRNWTSNRGVSTDAYTASVGTDGPFTAAINYLGYPLFFKENYLHRVYGSHPGEYRIQTTPCQGVAPDCGDSLSLLGDTALYLGRNGVCAYDGAMPTGISRELGQLTGPAVGCVCKECYYLAVKEGLFVYHSRYRVWHRRDLSHVGAMVGQGGDVYYCDSRTQELYYLEKGGDQVDFHFTTGIIAGSQQQRIRSLCLRYGLTGWARVAVEYDSSGVWQEVGELKPTGLGWAHKPARPRRCDHFRLKVYGKGSFRLHSIVKTLEKGSDLP